LMDIWFIYRHLIYVMAILWYFCIFPPFWYLLNLATLLLFAKQAYTRNCRARTPWISCIYLSWSWTTTLHIPWRDSISRPITPLAEPLALDHAARAFVELHINSGAIFQTFIF
jgi:hypothetical protein